MSSQSFIGIPGLPLGLRNNNVGNIRPSDTWQGQTGIAHTGSGDFVIFADVAWGVRAWAKNLNTSIKVHGTDTLRKYINRYAPPSENQTSAYLNSVSDSTGIDPDSPIPTDPESLKSLLRAQMNVELGPNFANMVTDEDIDEGLSRLGSPISSAVKAAVVFYDTNEKTVNYAVIGAVIIGLSVYVYYLKRKKVI